MNKRIIVGISGASGMIYAQKLIGTLITMPFEIHLIISEMGAKVLAHELGIQQGDVLEMVSCIKDRQGEIICHDSADMFAPVASGSFPAQAMVIIPCSMKTLSAVATGYTTNLLERAADVTLKERRPLILVTRETPLSHVHLTNMLAVSNAGATVMPACPGFYNKPESVNDLAMFMVGRVLDHLNIEHPDTPRWGVC